MTLVQWQEPYKKQWDDWNQAGGPKYPHEKVVQFVFRNFPLASRSHIRALDLGCGGGVHTVFLASEGFQVTGIDISEIGVAKTRQKLDSLSLSADLMVEGADRLSFLNESFDLVICVGVYDSAGLEVARTSVRKLFNVMAKGGLGIFLFASDRDFRITGDNPLGLHGYTKDEVESIFVHNSTHDFSKIFLDRYITTYQGGKIEQNDWLITIER